MLAQNFKTAAELDITEKQKRALMKVLVLLETGKMEHVPNYKPVMGKPDDKFTGHFNMMVWGENCECGTVRCIGGTAEIVGDVDFSGVIGQCTSPLYRLFFPPGHISTWDKYTDQHAARALRNFLTTGEAQWESVNDL